MASPPDFERLQGTFPLRVAANENSREFRYSPLKAQSQINRAAHEPPQVLRDARPRTRRDTGLGHGFEERRDVAQVYVPSMRFLQAQKRLISEKHVGLFSAEPASSGGIEAFTDQAAFAGAIVFDGPTHEGDGLCVLRSLRFYEPDRCSAFHRRKHSDGVPRAKAAKTPLRVG